MVCGKKGVEWSPFYKRERHMGTPSTFLQIKFNETTGNIYQSIELQANETFNYSLLMTLIEAEQVESELRQTK